MPTSNLGSESLSRDESAARKIARRLIESRQSERVRDDTPARAAAAACGYLYRDLARWVGHDGCHALFTRALAQARTEGPVLEQIQLRARSEPYLEGVAETIMAHGDAAPAKALESMLRQLIELLGRLIGDDMAMKLIERSLTASDRGGITSNSRREEA
ncbi:MAG: hypothetical protein WD802_01835 [Gemmatimonadaceae bacterium]